LERSVLATAIMALAGVEDEVVVLAYRWRTRLSLDDSLVRLRRLMPQLSRSALYRCLNVWSRDILERADFESARL
jgi:hypothetical protein